LITEKDKVNDRNNIL